MVLTDSFSPNRRTLSRHVRSRREGQRWRTRGSDRGRILPAVTRGVLPAIRAVHLQSQPPPPPRDLWPPCSGSQTQPEHETRTAMTGLQGQRENSRQNSQAPSTPWTLQPHLPEPAGPGWGCVTARESQWCHISLPAGLSPRSHGRSP